MLDRLTALLHGDPTVRLTQREQSLIVDGIWLYEDKEWCDMKFGNLQHLKDILGTLRVCFGVSNAVVVVYKTESRRAHPFRYFSIW